MIAGTQTVVVWQWVPEEQAGLVEMHEGGRARRYEGVVTGSWSGRWEGCREARKEGCWFKDGWAAEAGIRDECGKAGGTGGAKAVERTTAGADRRYQMKPRRPRVGARRKEW